MERGGHVAGEDRSSTEAERGEVGSSDQLSLLCLGLIGLNFLKF